MADKRRNDYEQLIFARVSLADIVDYGNMVWQCLLQIICAFVARFKQQGCRLTVHKCKDASVHIIDVTCHGPVKPLLEGVQGPQPGVVALCGYYRLGTDY